MIGRHPIFIQHHPNLPALPADDLDFGDIADFLDFIMNLGGDPPQHKRTFPFAPEGEGQNGDIVDGARLDQRRTGSGWDQVKIGEHLLIQTDDGFFFILADIEADDGQRIAWRRSRVDVFDPRNLPQELLHRFRHPLFHFLGRGSGHLDKDVDHGYDDLRLFLPGQAEAPTRYPEEWKPR